MFKLRADWNCNRRWQGLLVGCCILTIAASSKSESITKLQPYLEQTSASLVEDGQSSELQITLTNLNTKSNIWYLLEIKPGKGKAQTFHLENVAPDKFTLSIDPKKPTELKLVNQTGDCSACQLWNAQGPVPELLTTLEHKKFFREHCQGVVLQRFPGDGQESTKEAVADFLRRHVWGGEQITTIVKESLFKDKFLITSEVEEAELAGPVPALENVGLRPKPALIDEQYKSKSIKADFLDIDIGKKNGKGLDVGAWFAAEAEDGVYVSVIEPKLIDAEIMKSHTDRVRSLDQTEMSAVAYLVAFDMDKHALGFALGTKHPSLEWSARTLTEVVDKKRKGPDGIDSFHPLVATGTVSPQESASVIATFTGGFKRSHGAFKWGDLAKKNDGSHYGFIENGVVFSRLNPDLATIAIDHNGDIDMYTWADEDQAKLQDIRHARQNGVPLIDFDRKKGESIPGKFVGSWHLGNWSGSVDSSQRALRAGVCLQIVGKKKFLIYGYFSSATPNAMARVFQSYECTYAMHMDMNALEHTYLALYNRQDQLLGIQHLIKGMDVLDQKVKDGVIPRFIGMPDNRDFFFVLKRD